MGYEPEDVKKRIETLRKKVVGPPDERSDDITDEDRNALIEFDKIIVKDRRRNDRCGWHHHKNLLEHTITIAEETQCLAACLQDNQAGDDALEEITEWLHEESGYDDKSKQGVLSAIRVIAADLCEEMPEHIQEIKPSEYEEENPAPFSGNIVEYDEILAMIEESNNTRDKALFPVQWARGFRPMEELYTLQWKNIKLLDNAVKFDLKKDDKTDGDSDSVFVGAQLLKKWLTEDHPVHNDPEATLSPETYVWTKTDENELLTYSGFQARFEEIGERAGIEKDHSAQHLRRSSASILARQPGIKERHLRDRYDWGRNSDSPGHYIERHSAATSVSVARARGLDIEDAEGIEESPDTAPIPCTRCGEWTTRGLDKCIWCNHTHEPDHGNFEATDATIANPETAGEKTIEEMILDGELAPRDIRLLIDLKPQLMSDPQVFERLEDLLPKAEALYDDGEFVMTPTGIAGIVAKISAVGSKITTRWAKAKHAALSIHPAFKDYPPSPSRTLLILAGTGMIVATALAVIAASGLLGELLAGKPTAVGPLVFSLLVGVWLVHRDLPTVDEAVDVVAQDAE